MNQLTVDFETYYDTDYSLTKLQTDAYVLDPRFEVMGVSVKVNDGDVVWFSGDMAATKEFLMQFDWENSAVICHNTLFDGFILAMHFGIRPKLWMDTLCMARRLLPYLPSHSLAALSKHHKLPPKGDAVMIMLGRNRTSLTPRETEFYGEYCKHDVELTYTIAKHYEKFTPALELVLIDMTIRMFTEPKFVGDAAMMQKLEQDEYARKQALLAEASADKDILMSNDKFAARLAELGVTPPTKVSPKTGKVAWAFAKSDKDFTALLDHGDPRVEALVEARLGVKTTIAETRAAMMYATAKRGPLPVYLNYWGAKTTGRYSGGNKINWQNLPARGPSAGLRNAIKAPDGHVVLVGDSSNIELRVAMAAAGQVDVVKMIENGEDLYCSFATKMFNRTITKADKKERLLGKIAMLSLQYGAGWRKFKDMVRVQSGEIIADTSAESIVSLYRNVHGKIVGMWNRFDEVLLPEIHNGNHNLIPVDVHSWVLCSGEGFGVGGGVGVVYHDLKHGPSTDSYGRPTMEWTYEMGKKRVKLYGGKCFENYCQHVARQIVMWQTARINKRYQVVLSVHDEAVCVVREEEADEARAYMEECLAMAPPWCRGNIPLACETGVAKSYGEA